mmetsp:Transcript_6077/g.9177  ORF Transcript_6077/g.9177 Transcript_6077/m.9177 type:complete len:257 (+) Transcript_6077:242-1012(+)
MNKSPLYVIFDFDWSLINENSDTWVVQTLAPDLYTELSELARNDESGFKNQWTKLMDHIVGRMMTERGVSIGSLNEALRNIPIFKEIVTAIKLVHMSGARLAILSDANMHYISVILDHLGIADCFSDIVSNKAEIESPTQSTQTLRIFPYQNATSPHRCALCPSNLCKGGVLDSWRATVSENTGNSAAHRVVYIGDGRGDFCPSLRLATTDIVLCREGWALHNAIQQSSSVCAQVIPWSTGGDVLRVLELILQDSI